MATTAPSVFAIVFPSLTPLIPSTAFTQTSPTEFNLLLNPLLPKLPKELLFTLSSPLPDSAHNAIALSLYTVVIDPASNKTEHSWRGYITNTTPSALLSVFLETQDGEMENLQTTHKQFQVHIVVEPLAEVTQKETTKQAGKAEFCKRVGMDLFNFIQSYSGGAGGGVTMDAIAKGEMLVVPANVIDRWWVRFSSRMDRDPDFLIRRRDVT